jgi:protein O-GlcNAc transferase
MYLAAGLFEHHDRSRFEVTAFDNTPEDGSALRRRVIAAFDASVPIQGLSDLEAARLVASR